MVICPIARAVHCTGCVLFKFCPAKTILGDYRKDAEKVVEGADRNTDSTDNAQVEADRSAPTPDHRG